MSQYFTRFRVRALAALGVAVAGLPTTSAAQEFAANRTWVAYGAPQNYMIEYAADGTVARTLGPFPNVTTPTGLTFGPDGNLYICYPNEGTILAVNGSGAVVKTLVPGAPAVKPALAAHTAAGKILLLNTDAPMLAEIGEAGALERTSAAATAPSTLQGLAVARDGHAFAGVSTAGEIVEFDSSGARLRTLFTDPAGMQLLQMSATPSENLLTLWSGPGQSTVRSISRAGAVTSYFDAGAGAASLAPGPEGYIYIGRANGVVSVVLSSGAPIRTIASPDVTEPPALAIAFAPFRFNARATGLATRPGVEATKVDETVVLQYFPSHGFVTMTAVDDPGNGADVASLAGRTSFIFRGFEVSRSAADKSRATQGFEAPTAASPRSFGSMTLLWNGKLAATGGFTTKKGRGEMQYSTASGNMSLIMNVTKALN